MKTTTMPPGFHPVRHDRLLQEKVHDTYKAKGKLSEPTVCPQCQAVFQDGHWGWREIPQDAHSETCPACHRVNDRFPAGFLTLSGPFFQSHRTEIMSLISHEEQRAKREHALQRIMDIDDQPDAAIVTTTDIHLARACGEAVQRAYQGELEFHYNPEENLLRVHWTH